jgi:hypothetical protein
MRFQRSPSHRHFLNANLNLSLLGFGSSKMAVHKPSAATNTTSNTNGVNLENSPNQWLISIIRVNEITKRIALAAIERYRRMSLIKLDGHIASAAPQSDKF